MKKWGWGALTLPGYLKEIVARFSKREALVMHVPTVSKRWSYADLWEKSMEVARALVAVGVTKDTRVGILMTNRLEWVSCFFGTALAGGVAVPLSTFSTPLELEYLIKTSSVSVLLFEASVLKKNWVNIIADLEPKVLSGKAGQLQSTKFPLLRRLAVVGERSPGGMIEGWQDFLAHGSATPRELVDAIADAVKPTDMGGIFFSSGSTALPKGVLSAQRGIAIQLWRYLRFYSLDGDIRSWTPNGFFWSGVFAMTLGTTLTGGGSVILQPTYVASEALKLMEMERVTHPVVPWPHQAQQLEEAPNWKDVDLSAVRFCHPGTTLSRHPTVKTTTWVEPRKSYGCTETFTIATGYDSREPLSLTLESSGIALPGNTVKIVDPHHWKNSAARRTWRDRHEGADADDRLPWCTS